MALVYRRTTLRLSGHSRILQMLGARNGQQQLLKRFSSSKADPGLARYSPWSEHFSGSMNAKISLQALVYAVGLTGLATYFLRASMSRVCASPIDIKPLGSRETELSTDRTKVQVCDKRRA